MDMIQTKENREVKNSVFIDLFCYDRTAEDNVISLYNALHEETLPEGTRVEWMQLDNVIYMTLRNDVAFQVDGKTMIFAEHQSTINENMPLRSFLYAGRAYDSWCQTEDVIGKNGLHFHIQSFIHFITVRKNI